MKSDLNEIELAYATKELAERVGLAKPTVRKYAQILEEYGYEFIKNGDRRVFIEVDIEVMRNMKISDKIEVTAKEMAARQKETLKRKSDIENDINKAIQTISPSDMSLLKKESNADIAFSQKRYSQLVEALKNMAVEYAATKEKVESIEAQTGELVSLIKNLSEENKEAAKEKELIRKKLDLALEHIRKQEEQTKDLVKKRKKNLWKRLFYR